MSDHIQVMTTVDDRGAADRMAQGLVERRLVACAQILGPVRSTYRWEGGVAEDEEWLLFLKTRQEIYAELEEAIKELHPYTVPEILAVAVWAGNADYLHWLDEETSQAG